jgi:hypothetical protein
VALWQFDVALAPKGTDPVLGDEGYEITPLPELVVARATKYLTRHFGKPSEAMPGWMVFGDENGHRFDVLVDNSGSGSVGARVDARVYAAHVLSRIVEIADVLDCNLYVPELKVVIAPTKVELARAFGRSAAARFVDNPSAFFEELS